MVIPLSLYGHFNGKTKNEMLFSKEGEQFSYKGIKYKLLDVGDVVSTATNIKTDEINYFIPSNDVWNAFFPHHPKWDILYE